MKNEYVAALILVATVSFLAGVFLGPVLESGRSSMVGEGQASANIVAAAKESDTGVVGEVRVEIVPGDGDVLVETNPFIQADTQLSANKAKMVAEKYTGKSLKNHDIIYTIEMDSEVVGGPSAGAAMTLATIAAITGTITRSGRIGRVGSIPVKAYSAGKEGLENFYVPLGQSTKTNYEPVVETKRRGFLIYKDVQYQRQIFNISKYTQQNFGMKTSEVGNIKEAAQKMLK
jgi:uncharacterized protein